MSLFKNNRNASFFFVSLETPYRVIGFLLKTPARPEGLLETKKGSSLTIFC